MKANRLKSKLLMLILSLLMILGTMTAGAVNSFAEGGTDPTTFWDSSVDGTGWYAWSSGWFYVQKVTASGVSVDSFEWNGNTCDVVLTSDTYTDASFTFSTANYARSGEIRINGATAGTSSSTTQLELNDGAVSVTVQPVSGSRTGTTKTFNFTCKDGGTVPQYNVTLPTGTGYEVQAAEGYTLPVGSKGSFGFKVNILEDYKKGQNFKVKANGTEITPDDDGLYLISNIKANQEVTVEDVVTADTVFYWNINLPETQTGYKIVPEEGNESPVQEGKSYSFHIDISERYAKSSTFAVKANGTELTPDSEGVYTITDIKAHQAITVEGVLNIYDVTLVSGEGYTVEALEGSTSPVFIGGSYSFKVNIAEGYKEGVDFAVKVNGTAVTPNSEGVYTFTDIREAKTVTVEDVVTADTVLKYRVTLPEVTGAELAAVEGFDAPVVQGESYKFTITLADGYIRTAAFAVKANGVALDEEDGVFTISNVQDHQNITVTGVTQAASVTAPSGAVVVAGTFGNYWVYSWKDPVIIKDNENGTMTYYFEPISGNTFYRVQHPEGVTYWDYQPMTQGKAYLVTMDDMTKNGTFASGTIYHDFVYNYLDLGDIYLNVNAQNYLSLGNGATRTLSAFRNWQAIEGFSNAKIAAPDVHYEVVDINGNESDLVSVVPDSHNSGYATIRANEDGSGLAVIKVTYDAMIYKQGSASGYGAGGQDPTRLGAIWPECTGVIVVSVGQSGTAPALGMTINTDGPVAHAPKVAGNNIDAEHDLLYYFGDEGATYTFSPEEGSEVSIARCTLNEKSLSYSGFTTEGVTADDDGKVTVTGLTAGRHIVKVEKDGVANYQVLSARQVTLEVKENDQDGKVIEDWDKRFFKPGDILSVKLHNVNSPQEKLQGCYNNSFTITYYDENNKRIPYQNDGDHGYGQYNFSSMDQVLTVTIPEDWKVKKTYPIQHGAVAMSGFSGCATGGHRSRSFGVGTGMAEGTSGQGVLGKLPDITFNVNVKPYINDGLEKTVLASVDQDSAYELDLSEIFTDSNGDNLTYKVSVNDADPVDADEKYSFAVSEAGINKLVFSANDGIEDSDDRYTVVVKTGEGNVKPMRRATVAESEDVKIGRNETYKLDLSTIFEDAEGDALTYKVTAGDKEPADADEQFVYEPEGPEKTALVFRANDGTDDSEDTYTVNLTVVDGIDPSVYWNSATDGNGWVATSTTYCYVTNVSSEGVYVKDAKWTGDTCDIILDPETARNATFEFNVAKYTRTNAMGVKIDGTQYAGAARAESTDTIKVTLENGKKSVTVQPYRTATMTGTLKTFNFRVSNNVPAPAEGTETEIKARVKKEQPYKVDISSLFADEDGDALTYTVSVDGGEAVPADADYQYDTTGMEEGDTVRLSFKANDGMDDSEAITVVLRIGGSVKVDFTSQMSGGFLHAPQTGKAVSEFLAEDYGYTDAVDGVSALDVLVAAHELTFGDAFTAETAEDYLKVSKNNVDKQFGVDPVEGMMGDTMRGGFYLNHAFPNDGTEFDNGFDWVEYNGTTVGTQEVKEGDFVEFFFYENEYMADTYTWFTGEDGKYSRDFRQCAGEDLTLILRGFYAAEGRRCKNEEELINYDGAQELADQQLYVVNMETGAKEPIEDAVTDEDGEVTLNFKDPGKYVITAYGEDEYGMMTPIMTLTTVTVVEHDWDEGTYTTKPTATEAGEKVYKCKNDPSHTRTETVPAYGEETIKIDLLTQIKKNTLSGVYDDFEVSSEDAGKYGYEKPEAFWGKVTVADAAAAVHYEIYGNDFAENPENYLKINSSGTATMIFGEESMIIGFKVNDVSPEYPDNPGTGSVWNDTPLKSDDKVRIFMPRGEYYGLMDSYLMLDADKYDKHIGDTLSVTVTGDLAFGTMTGMPANVKPAEEAMAVLCKDYTDPEGTKVAEAVTDEEGIAEFGELEPGEYDLVVTEYENDFDEECFSTPYAKVVVTDHDWKWEVTQAPTLESEGKRERTCSICGEHEEEVIPKLTEATVDVRLNSEAGEPAQMYRDLYVRSDMAYNAGFEALDDMSTVTMADAVVAAHIREYGAEFKADTTGVAEDAQLVVLTNSWGPWISKIFNSTKSNSEWLNNEFAMTNIFDIPVADEDLVSVELYESNTWSDTYLYIDKDEYESDADGYVNVRLFAMLPDEYYNYNPEPVEGATIVLTGNDNDSLFEADTDEDGYARILADYAGSYTVSVEYAPYDYPWLPQTAEAVVAENAHTFKVARKNAIEEIRAYAEENKDKADPEEVEIAALKAENKIKDAETEEEIAEALEAGKSAIDALVQAAEDAVQALATAKQEAIDALDEIDLSEYDEDDQEEMEEIIESGKTAIENAQSVEQVDSIFDSVVSALDEYSTAAEKLDNEKAEALVELDEIDPEDYIESVREQVAQLIADAGTAIEAAQSSEDIDDIMSDLYEALDELETVEEVENIIADVEAALEEDFSPEDYVEADREKAAQLINAAKQAVANAKTIEEISGIMDDLVEQLKALTTTEEQDDALAKAKADAIAFLQNMIAEDSDKVLENDKVKLEVAALKAMFQVQNATDIDSVNNLVNEALGTADKLINDKIIADETAAAKKLKVAKLKAKSKKRKFTVSWKKNTEADGYQVQYKLKSAKKFKSLKKSTTKVKVTSKKLKKGKKYIFRVRPYKTVNGKKVYGKWAKTKAVKCK